MLRIPNLTKISADGLIVMGAAIEAEMSATQADLQALASSHSPATKIARQRLHGWLLAIKNAHACIRIEFESRLASPVAANCRRLQAKNSDCKQKVLCNRKAETAQL